MLGKVNNTLEETKGTGIPIKTNSIVQDLLRILPAGKTPTISQRKHDDAINSHTQHLAQTAETIRWELMPLAILTSNYANDARKTYSDLQVLLQFLVPLLGQHSLKENNITGEGRIDEGSASKQQNTSDNVAEEGVDSSQNRQDRLPKNSFQ